MKVLPSLKLKSFTEPLPPAITGIFEIVCTPVPFLVIVTWVTIAAGTGIVMKVWISSFALWELPPPLNTVIGLVTVIGFCSGKAISACAMPEPTTESPQTCIAFLVSRAVSSPGLQTG